MFIISNVLIVLTTCLLFLTLVHQSLQLTECHFLDNSSNPCVHGICLATNDSQVTDYQCYCLNGFTGINCTKKFNQCLQQNPCLNNAICVDLEDYEEVRCLCAPGFCGKYCESEINECLSNPCQNGGSCVDKISGYQCNCLNGFDGKNCENDKNYCEIQNSTQNSSNTQCLNGGTCVEGPGDKFFCACDQGHTGQRCEYEIRACDSNPCLSGGRCEEKDMDYNCICSLEWTGKVCEIGLIECSTNLCENNAICMQTIDNKTRETTVVPQRDQLLCYCLPDFYGIKCEHRYNDCATNPCLNDGICIDGIDSYTCNCIQGFLGTNCQIDCSNPLNEQICLISTISSIDMTTSTDIWTEIWTFTPSLMPSIETSIPIESTVYPSSYWPSIDVSSETPVLNITEIIESTLTTTFATPLPLITSSPTIEESVRTPKIEPNITDPTTDPPFTETPSPETKIFISRFNGINSSLIYRLKRSKRSLISISFSFKPDQDINGSVPLLYSKSRHNYELLIYIHNNFVKLLITKGLKQILLIESKFKITAKVFNKMDIKLWFTLNNKRINFMLKFNEIEKSGGYQQIETNSHDLCSFELYYFGKIVTNFDYSFDKNDSNLFVGCLKNVFINKYELFISDAIKATDISECVPNAKLICDEKPCRNGGHCRIDGQHWSCQCPEGYTNDLCETAYCSENLCHNDGVCILPDDHNYLCVCPYGWNGTHCEQEMKSMYASFNLDPNKNSFIKYNLQNLSNHFEVKFRFATQYINQSKALILFMSNQNYDQNKNFIIDFMSISLDSGVLFFTINLGFGNTTLQTRLDDKLTEQLVFFGHHNRYIWLVVVPEDSHSIKPIVGKTPKSFRALNVTPILYVGGHDSYTGHSFLTPMKGFRGCIYDIEIRTKLELEFETLTTQSINKSVNIGVCQLLDDCSAKQQ